MGKINQQGNYLNLDPVISIFARIYKTKQSRLDGTPLDIPLRIPVKIELPKELIDEIKEYVYTQMDIPVETTIDGEVMTEYLFNPKERENDI